MNGIVRSICYSTETNQPRSHPERAQFLIGWSSCLAVFLTTSRWASAGSGAVSDSEGAPPRAAGGHGGCGDPGAAKCAVRALERLQVSGNLKVRRPTGHAQPPFDGQGSFLHLRRWAVINRRPLSSGIGGLRCVQQSADSDIRNNRFRRLCREIVPIGFTDPLPGHGLSTGSGVNGQMPLNTSTSKYHSDG